MIFQLVVYSSIGFINTIVDYLIFMLITVGFHFDPVPSNVVSYSIGVTVSFFLNRRFTFRNLTHKLNTRSQLARFFAVYSLSLGLSTGFVYLFSQLFSAPVAKLLSIPVVVMWGFLAVRKLVFVELPREPTNTQQY